ncbi:hypothetical protein B0F90DRAFT_1303492 [Multifurca ochricompacta]|uniref:Ankyrin n=1 Tax=Multifurca ochricompacta TaxID=376703 RepID=A0AAD4QPV6_9AGAM|nr:hypothetical protein B0F90DRAFT_1303492 [Multifurca ochricompacta]
MNGVTPLGFVAWLNSPEAVGILLEVGGDTVSVDGKDAYGVTPLMYATRDGNLEVVNCLLSHGAYPDHRDRNHRTSIQYALDHPQILWACEEALRYYRAREIRSANGGIKPDTPEAAPQPAAGPSGFNSTHLFTPPEILERTDVLVKAIVTTDVAKLYSLLSTLSTSSSSEGVPSLVNAPDAEAWSPIHYCASLKQPSIEVLDILYCAGADVSLFSKTGNCTPLHCLARRKRGPDALRDQSSNDALYRFVVHLVRDLRAPLQAQDHNNETCIHIAAEHGDSDEILRAMLDSDPNHIVSEMRNSRGLTPFEVAKPEFRSLFTHFHEEARPASSASHATVRPLHNSGSNPGLLLAAGALTPRTYPATLSPPPNDDGSPSPFGQVLDSLSAITLGLSLSSNFTTSEAALDRLNTLLRDTSSLSQGVMAQLYSRVDEARDDISRARELWTRADTSLDTISHALGEKLKACLLAFPGPGAEDSHESVVTRRSSSETGDNVPTSPGFATELLMLDSFGNDNSFLKPWPRTHDSVDTANLSMTQGGASENSIGHLRSHKSMSDLHRLTPPLIQDGFGAVSKPVRRARADTLTDVPTKGGRPRQISETGSEGEGKGARLKAWLKRTFLPERPPRSPVQKPEEPPSSLTTLVEKDENAAVPSAPPHPSYRILATVGKDLTRIDECMSKADKLIASIHRAIVRAERKMKHALQARKKLIHDHRRARTCAPSVEEIRLGEKGDHLSSSPAPVALRVIIPRTEAPVPSPTQSPTTRSTASSISSLASVLRVSEETETETDTEVMRRLNAVNIEGTFERVYEVLEKVDIWLKIVKRVLEDVSKREGLLLEERM